VWGPLVFLYWGDAEADAPPSVATFLGDGGARLASELAAAAGNPAGQAGSPGSDWQWHKHVEYPTACNWKCMTDNYMDGNYHVFLCHPGLIGCLAMHDNFNLLYDNVAMLCGPSEVPSAWPKEGQPGGPLHHQMVTRTRGGKDQSYSCLYPNTFINRYGQWFSVTNVVPIGPTQCLTTFDLFFKPDTLANDPEFIAMAEVAEDELQQEDIALCLKVGANLASPMYAAGRYAPIESPSAFIPLPPGMLTFRLLTFPVCFLPSVWWWHQRLHKDVFGSAPGLKHRPTDDRMNKALYTL
jgi:phenylpropionate dioxygenase-like ring-hydroxylating dioxygenase large terminal subunit